MIQSFYIKIKKVGHRPTYLCILSVILIKNYKMTNNAHLTVSLLPSPAATVTVIAYVPSCKGLLGASMATSFLVLNSIYFVYKKKRS